MSELEPAPRSFSDKLSQTGPPATPWVYQHFFFFFFLPLNLSPPESGVEASPSRPLRTGPWAQHSAGRAVGAQ